MKTLLYAVGGLIFWTILVVITCLLVTWLVPSCEMKMVSG